MEMNLSQIKSDALAATQGEWNVEFGVFINAADGKGIAGMEGHQKQQPENARHIANMDPPTTIALVEEVERLREAIKNTVMELKGVRFMIEHPAARIAEGPPTLKDVEASLQRIERAALQALGEDNER